MSCRGLIVTALETYKREKRFIRYHSVELNRAKAKKRAKFAWQAIEVFRVPE